MKQLNRIPISLVLAAILLFPVGRVALTSPSHASPSAAESVKPLTKSEPAPGKKLGTQGLSGRKECLETGFERAEAIAGGILKGGRRFLGTFNRIPGEISSSVDRLTENQGPLRLLTMISGVLLVIFAGFFAEQIVRRGLALVKPDMDLSRFPQAVSCLLAGAGRFLGDTLAVLTYALATFLMVFFLYDRQAMGYLLVTNYLLATYSVQVTRLACGVILSPNNAMLRLLPFCDVSAPLVARWVILISAVANFITATSEIFRATGGSRGSFLLLYSCSGVATLVLLILLVLRFKKIREAHHSEGDSCAVTESGKGGFPVRYVLAILYIVIIWAFWEIGLFQEGADMVGKVKISLFFLPMFMAIDYWGQRSLDLMAEKAGAFYGMAEQRKNQIDTEQESSEAEAADVAPSRGDKAARWSSECYLPLMKRTLRIFIFGLLFFSVMYLWGIDLMRIRTLTFALAGLFLILLIWEFSKVTIERRLEQEMPETEEEMDEGGAGGSRTGTILILMRKMIGAVLLGLSLLLALSALGIDIGPLVAGAGIVGLAIGFGAQTLVKDIISGIFFLVDDAFRLGDYVDTGKVKGTVEQISLRSLRLRHHRGMVHTIPFGELGSVTNFSRDYIIMKLDFRVRYDTDIEKVRKIIKKMGKKIAANGEYGPKLLSPIKSQGVKALDDSAMIMRIKFKSIPGEQFVLRREIFRRVQEAFRENDIAFAHRNVTVYLPGEENGASSGVNGERDGKIPDEMRKRLAAGAGLAALEEAEKNQNPAPRPE